MSIDQQAIKSELKEILAKRSSLENKIERYKELFPTRVDKIKEKYNLDEQEAMEFLYMSDYLVTSTEIISGLTDEERENELVLSMIMGRDEGKIDFKSQLAMVNMCQQVILSLKRHINYQRGRGFPFSAINTQVIDTWINDFYIILFEYLPDMDIRWINAEFEACYFKSFAGHRYREIIKEFQYDEFIPRNYYLAAENLMSRLDISNVDEGYINTTAFNIQVEGTEGILIFNGGNQFFFGSTFEKEQVDQDILKEFMKNCKVKTSSENGDVFLKYYNTKVNKIPLGTGKRVIIAIETQEDNYLAFILMSSKLDEINYTSVKSILQKYLVDCYSFINKSDKGINNTLDAWVERLVLSQTVEGAETHGLPNDLIREKEWIFDSLITSFRPIGEENADVYARRTTHKFTGGTVHNLIEFNGTLHKLIDMNKNDLTHSFAITSHEAFFENGDDARLFQFHQDGDKLAVIVLQALLKSSTQYIHRKKHLCKRRYSRLQIKNLLKKGVNFGEWVMGNLSYKSYGDHFDMYPQTLKLREPYAGKELEIEAKPVGISVSKRLKELEIKKDKHLEIQRLIFEFVSKSMESHIKIGIIDDLKMRTFFNKDFKNQMLKIEKSKVEEIIDLYSIRRLPDRLGDKIIDIVNTMEAYFARTIREGLFKMKELEDHLALLELEDLDLILEKLKSSLD